VNRFAWLWCGSVLGQRFGPCLLPKKPSQKFDCISWLTRKQSVSVGGLEGGGGGCKRARRRQKRLKGERRSDEILYAFNLFRL
jgi:hypothetical protein